MIRLAVGVALLSAIQSDPSREKPKLPPFRVVITAATGNLATGEVQPLLNAIKGMKGYAEQVSRLKVTGEPDWLDEWTFEVPGDKKFDPTPFRHLFARFNARKYYLTMSGTLSLEEPAKKLVITSFAGKSKVKLVNKPRSKSDDPGKKGEDLVGKLTELFGEGQLHFSVSGEMQSQGGALAILLENFHEVDAPEIPKDGKK